MADETIKVEEQSPQNLIEQARQAATELQKQNEIKKELLDREEKMRALDYLGGRSESIHLPAPQPETPKEYKDRIMRGALNGN